MVFHRRIQPGRGSRRVALIPGSYNPPTHAHRALIETALEHAGNAVAVLPRAFPHKPYHGATLEDRLGMLEQFSNAPFSIAVSEGGLFVEMCEEYLAHDPEAEVFVACGRDAAERILEWRYDDPSMPGRMFDRMRLLVAARQGEFAPPPEYANWIERISIDRAYDQVSSTEIRALIGGKRDWRHLVPEPIHGRVEAIYGRG